MALFNQADASKVERYCAGQGGGSRLYSVRLAELHSDSSRSSGIRALPQPDKHRWRNVTGWVRRHSNWLTFPIHSTISIRVWKGMAGGQSGQQQGAQGLDARLILQD